MISLQESILSGRKSAIDNSKASLVMQWFRECKGNDFNAYTEPNGNGIDIIIDDFFRQPSLYSLSINNAQLNSMPNFLRGIYLNKHDRRDDEGYLIPIKLYIENARTDVLDLSFLDFTRAVCDDFTPIKLINCIFNKVVGLPKYKKDTIWPCASFRVCNIRDEISVNNPNLALWMFDGCTFDLRRVKKCNIHEFSFGDVAIGSTTGQDLYRDPNINLGWSLNRFGDVHLFTRRGSHWYTNEYLTGVLDELMDNNKIDRLVMLTNDIKVKGINGCGAVLKRKPNGWEFNKMKL